MPTNRPTSHNNVYCNVPYCNIQLIYNYTAVLIITVLHTVTYSFSCTRTKNINKSKDAAVKNNINWMTIVESGWNVWVWLVGVVSRRWVWLVGVGGIYGCG